jgi:hypothetical protein
LEGALDFSGRPSRLARAFYHIMVLDGFCQCIPNRAIVRLCRWTWASRFSCSAVHPWIQYDLRQFSADPIQNRKPRRRLQSACFFLVLIPGFLLHKRCYPILSQDL